MLNIVQRRCCIWNSGMCCFTAEELDMANGVLSGTESGTFIPGSGGIFVDCDNSRWLQGLPVSGLLGSLSRCWLAWSRGYLHFSGSEISIFEDVTIFPSPNIKTQYGKLRKWFMNLCNYFVADFLLRPRSNWEKRWSRYTTWVCKLGALHTGIIKKFLETWWYIHFECLILQFWECKCKIYFCKLQICILQQDILFANWSLQTICKTSALLNGFDIM